MKRNRVISVVGHIMGAVILILGLRLIAEGTFNYIEQHQQTSWIEINAEITDVSSRLSNTESKNGTRKTVYDITYEYEVDGEIYSDEIRSQPNIRLVGEDIRIKYNPETPSESTTVLSPSTSDLLVFVIFGLIFSVLGFFMSGAFALIRKLIRKGKPEETEELPSEEYNIPDNGEKKPKSFVKRIVITVIISGLILLSTKLFPGTQSADVDEFRKSAEAAGYTTSDTTEKLREEWRVGSMLIESASFDNGKVRMDFCVMDTVDSSENLYNSMTLPVTDGEIEDNDGQIHEFYSVESQTQYVAKIRIRDTVVYVSALSEYKNDVAKLLATLGYWKD